MSNPDTDLLQVVCDSCANVLDLEHVDGATNFFEAGGASLAAARLAGELQRRLGYEVPLGAVLRNPRMADLAEAVRGGRPRQAAGPAGVGGDDRLPVTPAQERLLLRDDLHRRLSRPPYVRTVSWCRRVAAALDPRALETAVRALVQRHDSLRTTYRLVDGHGYATVSGSGDAVFTVVDPTTLPDDVRLSHATRAAAADVDTPFDRGRLPRLRATLYRLGPADSMVHLVVDHMVGDARTAEILGRDLAELYAAAHDGREPVLPHLPVRYVDWVAREHHAGRRSVRERRLEHWRSAVAANRFFPRADLPFARPESVATTYRGAQHRLRFEPEVWSAFVRFARGHRTTPFVAYLATFVAMLHSITGERDITVVVPDDNREDPDVEHVVGWFATSVALRFRLGARPTFADVAAVTHEVLLTALDNRGVSFGEVLDAVTGRRRSDPVAVVRFEYNDTDREPPRFHGATAVPVELPFRSAGLGLAVWSRKVVGDKGGGVDVTLVHGLEHYRPDTVARVLDTWRALTDLLLARPDRPIADLMGGIGVPPRRARLVTPLEPT